jgi:hypothetical protein
VDPVGVEALGGGEVGGEGHRNVVEVEEPGVELGWAAVEVGVEGVQVGDEVRGGGDVLLDEVGRFVGVRLGCG